MATVKSSCSIHGCRLEVGGCPYCWQLERTPIFQSKVAALSVLPLLKKEQLGFDAQGIRIISTLKYQAWVVGFAVRWQVTVAIFSEQPVSVVGYVLMLKQMIFSEPYLRPLDLGAPDFNHPCARSSLTVQQLYDYRIGGLSLDEDVEPGEDGQYHLVPVNS